MNPITRRDFLRTSAGAGLALALPKSTVRASQDSNPIRVAVIGMGDTQAVGGVGGRGHQLLAQLKKLSEFRIVALCDVNRSFLEREARPLQEQGRKVSQYRDLRQVFDDKSVDAVVVATPNHWHALATIWACQAGKDVYVEKPCCYNIWEGRQMIAAARKYGRIVQVGMQNRSSGFLKRTFAQLRGGSEIGPIRFAHAIVYRPRDGIGTVTAPTPIPEGIDYDLWCGPAAKGPLMRKQLNYEWHWFWATGNGEIGNNGVHVLDLCRWALGQDQAPPRAMSIGGRFGFHDCGQTANTQIAILDYHPAPVICEIRNLHAAGTSDSVGKFRGRTGGLVIDCEGGYFSGDASGGALFDKAGHKIRDLSDEGEGRQLEALHLANFAAAIRSRKTGDLAANIREGHLSAACCHLPNLSHRLGKGAAPQAILETVRADAELLDAFERCREYLQANGVDLNATPAALGPWIGYDSRRESFVGPFAEQANALSRREDRVPYTVPALV